MLSVNSNFNLALPIVRSLTADDTSAYRALRQKILVTGDGRYFSDSYTREAQLNEKQWQKWCTETHEHCIFGTFHNNCLIGVMMVTQQAAPNDNSVEWEAIWLEPRYRRQGIARLTYKQIRRWTLDQGYNRVVLYIRSDNLRSQEIHKKQGARYLYTKYNEVWADGSVENTRCYKIDLSPPESVNTCSQHRALEYLEATHSSLIQVT